jgi:hydroxypyruvate isomerase
MVTNKQELKEIRIMFTKKEAQKSNLEIVAMQGAIHEAKQKLENAVRHAERLQKVMSFLPESTPEMREVRAQELKARWKVVACMRGYEEAVHTLYEYLDNNNIEGYRVYNDVYKLMEAFCMK